MKRLKIAFPQRATTFVYGANTESNEIPNLFGEQRNAHFNGGGGGGETDEEKLMLKIKGLFQTEIQTRGLQNTEGITAAINKHLEGLNLDALRGFEAEKTKIDAKILSIAAEQEKLAQRGSSVVARNAFKESLDAAMADIEVVHRSQGTDKREFKFNARAAVVMDTTNVVDSTVIPEEILDSFTLGAFVEKRRGRQFVYDLATRTTVPNITEYKTWLEEGSEQGAFAIVAEGALKPLVSQALVRNIAKTKKIAGKYVITEEFAKFKPQILAIVKRLINQKMVRDYSAIITADMIAASVGYTGTILDGTILAPTDYHAIGAVIAQEQSLNFNPDVLVIHPQDEWRIRLTTDADGRFLFPVTTQDGETNMLGLRIVTSTYQVPGRFSVAESGLFEIEEDTITVRLGYGINYTTGGGNVTSVDSDFDTNRMRMIVEMFFRDYLATPYIGSIVTATFASVKTALQSA